MRAAFLSVVLAVSGLTCACGGDSDDGGGGGTAGSGGSAGTGGSAGGGGSAGTGGNGGGAGTTACGTSLKCDAKSVCIVDEKPASCSAKLDDAGSCPPGQTETQCGGIGYPCCCAPPPPSEYRCVDASACSAQPDCGCLGSVCKNGQMCMGIGGKEREFHCSDPPAP